MEATETTDATVGALKDLVGSEGWRLFRAWAKQQFGPEGYGVEIMSAVADIPPGPDRAYQIAEITERVDATARAVNLLIEWPANQIKAHESQNKPSSMFERMRRTHR